MGGAGAMVLNRRLVQIPDHVFGSRHCSPTRRVLLHVFVRCCAAGSAADCPAPDVRVDASKQHRNQNMLVILALKDRMQKKYESLFLQTSSFESSVPALRTKFL